MATRQVPMRGLTARSAVSLPQATPTLVLGDEAARPPKGRFMPSWLWLKQTEPKKLRLGWKQRKPAVSWFFNCQKPYGPIAEE